MDSIVSETKTFNHNSFLNHVFSTSDESKAEILNTVQYSLMAIIPIVALNKFIQKFVPEADIEKSSLEILAEVFLQIVVMFVGIILIHRMITFVSTYSGYKYENFNLTTVVLAFLMIVLSLQTKLGLKINILSERLYELWNGPGEERKSAMKKAGAPRVNTGMHQPSQADHFDASAPSGGIFPPAPMATAASKAGGQGYDYMVKVSGGGQPGGGYNDFEPAPANSLIGGGASFW